MLNIQFLASVVWNTFDMRKKKEENPYNQESFYSAKKET